MPPWSTRTVTCWPTGLDTRRGSALLPPERRALGCVGEIRRDAHRHPAAATGRGQTMTGDVPSDRLRAELEEVESTLASVRRTVADIRASIGDAEDPADRGSLIQQADEQDSVADQLAVRRDDLLRRL